MQARLSSKCLICNKDGLAMKTLTRMSICTDKCVSAIRVDTLENIIFQSDVGKDSLANLV